MINNRQQNEGETFKSFQTSIRLLIRSCNYSDSCTPSILRVRIVLGARSTSIQTALLKEGKLHLKTAIDICKASENATVQHQQMKGRACEEVISRTWADELEKPEILWRQPPEDENRVPSVWESLLNMWSREPFRSCVSLCSSGQAED